MDRASALLTCLLACGLALLSVSADAQETSMLGSWHVSVTNVQVQVWDPYLGLFWTEPCWSYHEDSSHIAVECVDEDWQFDDWVNFSISPSPVVQGQEDAYVEAGAELTPNYYHAVQFDWAVDGPADYPSRVLNWAAVQQYHFEIRGSRMIDDCVTWVYSRWDTFYPGYGQESGHATLWATDHPGQLIFDPSGIWSVDGVNQIELHLVATPAVVPEPSCLLLVATALAGLGAMHRSWK
jgi:hypothetical protein